jgi:hypothetical protein
MDKPLEKRLIDLLYDVQVEDIYINDTFTGIVYLMKKVAEDEKYALQLYDIGKEEDSAPSSDDTLKVYLKKLNKVREKQFGLENSLKSVLWNGQVEERDFDKLFNEIIVMMKEVSENNDYKTQLYKINLDNYRDEEE